MGTLARSGLLMPWITPSFSVSICPFLPPTQKKCSRYVDLKTIIFQGPTKKAPTSGASSSSSSNCTETASTSANSSCFGETDSGVDFEDISDKISEGGDSAEDSAEDESENDGDDGMDKNNIGGTEELNNGDSISKGEGRGGYLDDEDDADSDVGEVETDSDDFTDSEDDTVEFMPDGEQVRKCKRGFKILQNCKRFWKVDNNV